MPYKFYCRNWDFRLRPLQRLLARGSSACFLPGHGCGMAGCAPLTGRAGRAGDLHLQGSRQPQGRSAAWRCCLCCSLSKKFLPRLFDSKIFYGLALALPVALAVFSLYAGYVYNPEWPYERMALLLLSIALSGRFEIWHNVFWSAPLSLLGGLPTDGDEHHAIDNTFLAVPMNKGLLGAILVAAVFLLLLWRLAKKSIAPPRSSAW